MSDDDKKTTTQQPAATPATTPQAGKRGFGASVDDPYAGTTKAKCPKQRAKAIQRETDAKAGK